MATGRPTVYSAETTIKLAREYLDSCFEYKNAYMVDEVNGKKKPKLSRILTLVRIPTLEGLAYHLKIHRDTLYEWDKLHKDFSDILEEVKQKQAEGLIQHGLDGRYNSTIAKVLLTKHGYREGHEHANPDGSNLFDAKAKEKSDNAVSEFLGAGDSSQGE